MYTDNTVKVSLGTDACGEAGTTSALCFTTLCFLLWANGMGWLGQGATIALSAFQLGVFAMYAYGGITHIKRGEAFFGNVYCIFAAFFGGASGAMNLVGAIAEIRGFAYSWQVEGWVFLVVGVIVLATVPVLVTFPLSFFGIFLSAGVSCVLWGLMYMNVFPAAAQTLGAVASWSIFVCGILGTYTILSSLYAYAGVKMDFLSKPLAAPKK